MVFGSVSDYGCRFMSWEGVFSGAVGEHAARSGKGEGREIG